MANDGLFCTEYPRLWAFLLYKGYPGVAEVMRGISPKKKPMNCHLSLSDQDLNHTVSNDSIIVENYFGRCCGLWTLLRSQWKWSQAMHDHSFRVGLGPDSETCTHVTVNVLCAYHVLKFRRGCNSEIQVPIIRILWGRNYRERGTSFE